MQKVSEHVVSHRTFLFKPKKSVEGHRPTIGDQEGRARGILDVRGDYGPLSGYKSLNVLDAYRRNITSIANCLLP